MFTSVRPRILASILLLVSGNAIVSGADSSNPDKPNIVFILADDLGYRELGSFGQQLIKTPRLDDLASEGMRLTHHYSGNAVCAPSRCVLMTGKSPGHAYVRNNHRMPTEGQFPIPESEVTIAELLKQQGYTTGAFGKWGLGGPESTGRPLNQGVDRFFGYNCQSVAHSYYPTHLWDDDHKLMLDNDPPVPGHAPLAEGADIHDPRSYDQFKGTDYAPDRINQQVLQFIRDNRDGPFFLYYPSIIPHVALHIPDEDLEPYLAMGWNDPPFTKENGVGYTPHFTPRAAYAAMITRLDRYIGNVLDLLDELGLSENTLVVFSSDNGATYLEEVDYAFFKSVGELRGLKGSLYEGGVRVPTIVRWPGRVAPGTENDRVSGFEDWLPTFADAVGAIDTVPDGVDGISMLPTLLGESQSPRPYLYREFPAYGGQQSIRVGNWKAIRQDISSGNEHVELYDLGTDASEQNDVATKHPGVVKKLVTMMQQARVPSKEFPLVGLDSPPRQPKKRATAK
tara:strand:- start:146841 stop:148370 length:1530 start_codon:yes stop_codon:yes gene_type:complete